MLIRINRRGVAQTPSHRLAVSALIGLAISLGMAPTIGQTAHPADGLSIRGWIETGGGVGGICLSPDGSRIYVAYWGLDGGAPIREYDAASGRLLRSFRYDAQHCHGDVVVSACGRFLYTTHYYFTHASRIDLTEEGEEAACQLGGDRSAVWAADIDSPPDRSLLAVAVGRDGRNHDMGNDQISIIDISNGAFRLVGEAKLPDELAGHKMGFSRDGHFVYVVTRPRQSAAARLYEISLKPPYQVTRHLEFSGANLEGVAVCDATGKVFVSDTVGKKIWAVDHKQFKPTSSISLEGAAPGTIAVSHDGRRLYVLLPATRSLFVVDTAGEHVLARLKGLRRDARDLELSPDDSRLFVAHGGEEGGVCVIATAADATQGQPASDGSIVFSSDRDGNYQIFHMNADGGDVRRLTDNNATEQAPRWSPDGRRIAFISDRDGPVRVMIMNEDGAHVRVVPDTDATPGDVNAGVPLDWSPDGRRLVFTSADHTAIRVVNLDGSGLRTIVKGRITRGYSYYHGVSWRRADTILFNAARPSWGYDQDIFAVDPDSGEANQITDEWGDYGHCQAPDLSPDGRKIAVLRQPFRDPPPRNTFLMNIDGTELVNLTNSKRIDAAPRWSRDGKQIVFCSGSLGRKHIWIVSADGGGQRQLTIGDADDIHPDIR